MTFIVLFYDVVFITVLWRHAFKKLIELFTPLFTRCHCFVYVFLCLTSRSKWWILLGATQYCCEQLQSKNLTNIDDFQPIYYILRPLVLLWAWRHVHPEIFCEKSVVTFRRGYCVPPPPTSLLLKDKSPCFQSSNQASSIFILAHFFSSPHLQFYFYAYQEFTASRLWFFGPHFASSSSCCTCLQFKLGHTCMFSMFCIDVLQSADTDILLLLLLLLVLLLSPEIIL